MVWWKIYWSFITDQLSVGKSGGLVETEDEVVLSSEVAHQALEVGEYLLCRYMYVEREGATNLN